MLAVREDCAVHVVCECGAPASRPPAFVGPFRLAVTAKHHVCSKGHSDHVVCKWVGASSPPIPPLLERQLMLAIIVVDHPIMVMFFHHFHAFLVIFQGLHRLSSQCLMIFFLFFNSFQDFSYFQSVRKVACWN